MQGPLAMDETELFGLSEITFYLAGLLYKSHILTFSLL